jgi:hypothetical protein
MLTKETRSRILEIADRIELQGAREGDLGMSAADAATFLRCLADGERDLLQTVIDDLVGEIEWSADHPDLPLGARRRLNDLVRKYEALGERPSNQSGDHRG